jgi:uncharacterized delta-60 repeat protein
MSTASAVHHGIISLMRMLNACMAIAILAHACIGAATAQTPGALDPEFGRETGLTSVATAEFSTAHEAVSLSDGSWIMSGYVREAAGTKGPRYRPSLTRFRPDGTLDTSYGNQGTVLGPGLGHIWSTTVLRSEERIYQVVTEQGATGSAQRLHVYAYDSNGLPDLAFGASGRVLIPADVQTTAASAAIQSGRLLIAAGGRDPAAPNVRRPLLVRLTETGSLDLNFSGSGIAYYRPPEDHAGHFTDIALQPDGRIVAVGETYLPASEINLLTARLKSNGELDPTFGSGGFRRLDLLTNDYDPTVKVRSDGRILIAATACSGTFNSNEVCMPSVSRLLGNGAFDVSFGSGAPVFHPVLTDLATQARVESLAEDPQGRILLGGSIDDPLFSGYLLRLSVNGARDASFGTQGSVVAPYREDGWVGELASVQLTSVPRGGLVVPRIVTVGRRQRAGGPKSERVIARHLYDDAPIMNPHQLHGR